MLLFSTPGVVRMCLVLGKASPSLEQPARGCFYAGRLLAAGALPLPLAVCLVLARGSARSLAVPTGATGPRLYASV